MPELPEVESIRTQLEMFLEGHSILSVEKTDPKIFQGNPPDIEGSQFTSVRRFGKVLIIDLDNDFSIMIHVKLTGQLIYRGPNLPNPRELSKKVAGGVPGRHTHVIFKLNNGGYLYYNDYRKFGWVKVIRTADSDSTGIVGKMGPEPFSTLTLEKFRAILGKTKRPIKVTLMDQERMSGVGNIYANDALYISKINPKRQSSGLTYEEQEVLYNSILSVLEKGMKYGGASELAFVTPDGQEGTYQMHTRVYNHTGETCVQCKKGVIEKYMLGGRGTYVCPICQA